MRRREFITLLGGAAAWPLSARAQQPAGPVRLIGVLMGYADSDQFALSLVAAFRGALAKQGWTESSNFRVEVRWAAGDFGKAGTFAKELVRLQPDAILGQNTFVIEALARETRTIPIVFSAVGDPIGSGFTASLAHPGGNITGFSNNDPAMGGKWLELLKEIAPRTVRIALLFNPATAPPLQSQAPSIRAAASSLAVQASATPVHAKDEFEGIIAAQARNPGGGLIVMPDGFNTSNRDLIISLAARYGVPAIFDNRQYAESGGLISYGVDLVENIRLAAGYIDRILKGAKPADLPVQQPTKFEMVINMKTAKALGLTVTNSMQLLADDVIE
jgi:putative ABC transport system substrate-binding protein